MKHFIFDVDGTLTPSRGTISTSFKEFFTTFCKENKVCLVTGSDKPKTIEQLGEEIFNLCERVYNCSGNDVSEGQYNTHTSNWVVPDDVKDWLDDKFYNSDFELRTGNHLEERIGTANFSIVGRNANKEQRALYVEYDTEHNERYYIAKELEEKFTDIQANVGGETGIDIFPKGCDKSQILVDFNFDEDEIHFFGDKMEEGGNDYPLKQAIMENMVEYKCYHVKDYKETFKILKEIK